MGLVLQLLSVSMVQRLNREAHNKKVLPVKAGEIYRLTVTMPERLLGVFVFYTLPSAINIQYHHFKYNFIQVLLVYQRY